MILMRVAGTVLSLPNDSEVLFDAGIDSLERFKEGESFVMQVEVVERDGDRMVVKPSGLAPVEES
jgi:hypothetical protein